MIRPTLAAVALVLAAGAGAALAGPLVVTSRAPEARDEAGRMLVLVLEAGPEGVVLKDARVVAGAPRLRRGDGPVPADAVRWAVRDATERELLQGVVEVPWVLHGDVPAADGSLSPASMRRERAAFVLRLPIVTGAAWLTFHDPAPAGGEAPARAETGRIALEDLLR